MAQPNFTSPLQDPGLVPPPDPNLLAPRFLPSGMSVPGATGGAPSIPTGIPTGIPPGVYQPGAPVAGVPASALPPTGAPPGTGHAAHSVVERLGEAAQAIDPNVTAPFLKMVGVGKSCAPNTFGSLIETAASWANIIQIVGVIWLAINFFKMANSFIGGGQGTQVGGFKMFFVLVFGAIFFAYFGDVCQTLIKYVC